MYRSVRSFDEKIYISDTYHKHLSRNEIPCQAVFNKMSLDSIPDELKDLKKLEKILISKRIIFKKIAIMHGKGEFAKIKGSICNIPLKQQIFAVFCQDLQIETDSLFIVMKLKRDLKYRGYCLICAGMSKCHILTYSII